MPKKLRDWLESDVQPYRDKSVRWILQFHFFRDAIRPTYSELSYFFSPADGIILYQHKLRPDQCLAEMKGRSYSLRDAIRRTSPDARVPPLRAPMDTAASRRTQKVPVVESGAPPEEPAQAFASRSRFRAASSGSVMMSIHFGSGEASAS